MEYSSTARQLIMPIGISGSGKSTLINHLYGDIPHVRISRDSIRKEICGDEEDHSREVEVGRTAMIRLRQTLQDRNDARPIIIDNTNIRYADRKEYYNMVTEMGLDIGEDIILAFILINLTPEEAIKRQLQRDRQVPAEAIHKQFRRLALPKNNELKDGIPYQMLTINSHSIGNI